MNYKYNIYNIYYTESCEKAHFSVKQTRTTEKGLVIDVAISRKYSSRDIELEIDNVFNNWQHDINFNIKRTTRAASKNARKGSRGGQIDLNRVRFHLREDQVKYDLRQLLDREVEFDAEYANHPHASNRFGINIHDTRGATPNGRDGSLDFDSEITNAFHPQPSYVDRHHINHILKECNMISEVFGTAWSENFTVTEAKVEPEGRHLSHVSASELERSEMSADRHESGSQFLCIMDLKNLCVVKKISSVNLPKHSHHHLCVGMKCFVNNMQNDQKLQKLLSIERFWHRITI